MDSVLSISEYVIHHLWSVSWQVTILIAIIWLIDRLSFRASSLFRYWLWMIVLVRLCIPVSIELPTGIDTSFVNRVEKEVTDFRYRHIPEYKATDEKPSPITFPDRKLSDPVPPAAFDSRSYIPPMSVTHKLFFVWYAVFMVICIYIAARTLAIIHRLKLCRSVVKPELVSLLDDLTGDLGIKRPVKLLYMDNDIGDVPAVVGLFRRGILIPRSIMDTWQAEDITPILLHELAHIKRKDLLINLLQLIVHAAFFFHPLVWYANRRILQYREEICDDMAVQALGGRRKHYTISMVRVMENALREPSLGFVGIGFTERESTVKRRIKRILSDTYKISTRLSVLSIVLLICIGIAGISLSCEKSSDIWSWKRSNVKVGKPPSMAKAMAFTKVEHPDSSTIRLRNPANIIVSSLLVIMNSDTLAYGIDYSYDQKTGDFILLAEESWSPEADILVMYDTNEPVQISSEVILQLTEQGQNLTLGSTVLEKNGRVVDRKIDAAILQAYKEGWINRVINIRTPVSDVQGEYGLLRNIKMSLKKSGGINRNEIDKINIKDDRIIVEIDENGNILVNGYTVTYASFEAYLAQERHKTGNNTISIRGDVTNKHSEILKLMRISRSLRYESIATDVNNAETRKIVSKRGKIVENGNSIMSEIHLTSTHIIKGSDRTFLNGKLLDRDKDYFIDYTTGIVTILNERAMYPEADLVIQYEEGILGKEEVFTRPEKETLIVNKEPEKYILSRYKKAGSYSSTDQPQKSEINDQSNKYPDANGKLSGLLVIARDLYKNSEYERAISIYRKIIDEYPDDPQLNNAWFEMALAYRQSGNEPAAVEPLLKVNPSDKKLFTGARFMAAQALRHENKWLEVVEVVSYALEYPNAIQDKSMFSKFYIIRGTAQKNLNNMIEAISDYTKAIDLNHQETREYAVLNRARVYIDLTQFADARRDLRKLADSSDAQIRRDVRNLISIIGDKQNGGKEIINQRLELYKSTDDPVEKIGHLRNLIQEYYENENWEEFEKYAHIMLDSDFAEGKKPRDADFFYKEEAQYYLGNALEEQEKYLKAVEYYRRGYEQFPDSFYSSDMLLKTGVLYMTKLYRQSDALDQAAGYFEKYIHSFPDTPNTEMAHYYLGLCYYNERRFKEAASSFKSFTQLYPVSDFAPEGFFYLADSNYNLGNLEEAITSLDVVIETYPNHEKAAMALHTKAYALIDKKQDKEAINALKIIIEQYPESKFAPIALFSIADYYYNEGKYIEAIESYKKVLELYPYSEVAKKVPETIHDIKETIAYSEYQKGFELIKKAEETENAGFYRQAAEIFNTIIEEYSNTDIVINAYSELIKCYKALGETQKVKEITKEMEKAYDRLKP